jgi:FMN reductase
MTALHLAVVSAGLSDPSSTRLLADRLADATRRHLQSTGRHVASDVVELRELATEIARNLTLGSAGQALEEVIETVTHADGLIVVTPTFSASYSGLFKSFFDLIDPVALTGMPVLLAATGGTARHSLVLEHALRPLFSYLHAVTVPTAVYAATEDWGTSRDVHTADLPARITKAARELAHLMPLQADNRRPAGNGTAEVIPFAQQLTALGHAP